MFRPLVLLALLICLFAVPGALAISIAEMTLEELIKEADYVVIASQQSSKITEKEPFVIREYTLKVEKTLKGDSGSGDLFTVYQDTGYGGPSYKKGQLFLAFIATSKKNNDHYVINGIQGLWPLDENRTPTWWGSEHTMDEIERTAAKLAGAPSGNDRKRTPPGQNGSSSLLVKAWPFAAAALVLAAVAITVWFIKKRRHKK